MLQFGEEKDILLMALHFFPSHFHFLDEKGSIKQYMRCIRITSVNVTQSYVKCVMVSLVYVSLLRNYY